MHELVEYYRQPDKGLVHHLTKPVASDISKEDDIDGKLQVILIAAYLSNDLVCINISDLP